MKPIIGLTCQNEDMVNKNINKINCTYIDAVVESGGVPVVIPILKDIENIERYLDIVDGIIFTGGEDISSLYFDEEPIREVDDIYHDRDKKNSNLPIHF